MSQETWAPEDKLRILSEAYGLRGRALATLLLRLGLNRGQLNEWHAVALRALAAGAPPRQTERPQTSRQVSRLRVRIEQLERELRRTVKSLSEAKALLALSRCQSSRKSWKGCYHDRDERQRLMAHIARALQEGVRLKTACAELGISARTVHRWRDPSHAEDRRGNTRRCPANKLSEQERSRLLAMLASSAFRGVSPKRLVPILADQGIYLASESTLYRLRRSARPGLGRLPAASGRAPSRQVMAVRAPNRGWSWDITYLRGPARGSFLYLYLIMDVYSRRIMGWRIHAQESMELAASLISHTCKVNAVDPKGLILRSDNGGPMRGSKMLAALRTLGIVPSFSRPQVRDDNPFSEALFRTLKQHPAYPAQRFASIESASTWMEGFVAWYNGQHLHSGLQFVTPNARHFGQEHEILARRRWLYERARLLHPARWSTHIRNWSPAGPAELLVSLDPKPPGEAMGCRSRQLD
ncbi:transposase [Stigmatella aurantiaca DW4/3-1]|nr:IS3 family transposase [Stigmatella aurantiaca]EAU67410.1 transposase [Stigmatella aurantiaca DW4/3-1]